MRAAVVQRLRARCRRSTTGDDGQILMMIVAYAVIALLFVFLAVDITAMHLARTQLLDAADAAARDAADAVDVAAVIEGGVGAGVPLTDETVRSSVVAYLSTYDPPARVPRSAHRLPERSRDRGAQRGGPADADAARVDG